MTDQKTILNELRANIVAKIEEFNKALVDNDLAKTSTIEEELKLLEAEYAKEKQTDVFVQLKHTPEPLIEAIKKHTYFVVSHKSVREDGILKGFEVNDEKPKIIDLVSFCTFCNLPTTWRFKVERFNQLLTLRLADELGLKKNQITKIFDSFYMNEKAKEVEMGGTPTSNTQMLKQLQMIIDEILFADDGNGKNSYKANSRDVAYILACHSRRGKKVLNVAVAKNTFMHTLILDVAHRIATGKVYDLEYNMTKKSDKEDNAPKTVEKAATSKKVSKPKTEPTTEEVVVVEKQTA